MAKFRGVGRAVKTSMALHSVGSFFFAQLLEIADSFRCFILLLLSVTS